MSPPRIFVRRCIKQISLPLARRYPSLYPNKSFIIELRSISLSIVLIHIEGIQNGFPSRFFPLKSPPPRLISTLPYSSLPIDHHPRFSSTVPRAKIHSPLSPSVLLCAAATLHDVIYRDAIQCILGILHEYSLRWTPTLRSLDRTAVYLPVYSERLLIIV